MSEQKFIDPIRRPWVLTWEREPRSRSTGRIPQENTGNRRNVEAVFRETDPVAGFIRFRLEQAGTWQNRQPDTVIGFLRRIPDIFRRVPTGNSAFPAGFSRKIHGILRQEPLSWEADLFGSLAVKVNF
jgi:hypothetical protein